MKDTLKKIFREYFGYIVVIIIVVLIRSYVVTPVRVSGTSMDKTLKNGEIMLLFKISDIKREDIIVINKKVEGNTIIKRLIGMPGDKISCENGIIYLNGKKYSDKYAYGENRDFESVTLGKDEYFVLGDNREVSFDSRYFGPVSKKYIEGKADFILFPFSKFGVVD